MVFAINDLSDWAAIIVAVATLFNTIIVFFVRKDVRRVEIATNSMKDTAINLSKKMGLMEGEAKGRADMKAEESKKDTQ